jgi:hypothetical protein
MMKTTCIVLLYSPEVVLAEHENSWPVGKITNTDDWMNRQAAWLGRHLELGCLFPRSIILLSPSVYKKISHIQICMYICTQ